jgi:hypothetical protein
MAVRDMRPTGLCTDCTTERSRAFEMDDSPFLPEDE